MFMETKELKFLNGISILSPQQYYKLLCSDFDLNFRLGYKNIAALFGLSKGQINRMFEVMKTYNLMDAKRRFVYISSFNSNDPREAINKMNFQFATLHNSHESDTHPAFNRMIYRSGCLLYEMEGFVESLIDITFKSSGFLDDLMDSDEIIHQSKYKNLSKKIYGDVKITKSKYDRIFVTKSQ